jgi:hypothetical protein
MTSLLWEHRNIKKDYKRKSLKGNKKRKKIANETRQVLDKINKFQTNLIGSMTKNKIRKYKISSRMILINSNKILIMETNS